jgi:antibiotic biosynthesis monooxygenase (ABM) superfamily enzyme
MTAALRLVLTWLAVWPIVTAALYLLNGLEIHLPLPLKTLILSASLVPLMALAIAPAAARLAHRLARRWTRSRSP